MYPVYYPLLYRSSMPHPYCYYTLPNMMIQGFNGEIEEGYLLPYEPLDIEEGELEEGLEEVESNFEEELMRYGRNKYRQCRVEEPVMEPEAPTHLHEVPAKDGMDMMQPKKMSPYEILEMIERHHPDMVKTLTCCGMPLDDARKFISRIIAISLHHSH